MIRTVLLFLIAGLAELGGVGLAVRAASGVPHRHLIDLEVGDRLYLLFDQLGKLFGDKGYISKALFETLWADGLHLITRLKKNMKNHLMPMIDKILLRKRALIETINDQLKNISQIEHTRHRSVANFMVNLLAGLIAYTYQPRKPSLNIVFNQPVFLNERA